jgi:hypothetical protein
MAKGLEMAVKPRERKDPPVQELLGPIKEELAKVVEEKIKLLYADGRA